MSELFDVGVVGSGYVGLTTGACLAHMGHRVTCVDIDAQLVAELGKGRIPFYEPGLEELVEGSVLHGRLSFSTDLAPVVRQAEVIFIAVGTPQGNGGSADLSGVAAVARGIGRALSERGRQGKSALRGQQEHGACGLRRLRLHASAGGRRG